MECVSNVFRGIVIHAFGSDPPNYGLESCILLVEGLPFWGSP